MNVVTFLIVVFALFEGMACGGFDFGFGQLGEALGDMLSSAEGLVKTYGSTINTPNGGKMTGLINNTGYMNGNNNGSIYFGGNVFSSNRPTSKPSAKIKSKGTSKRLHLSDSTIRNLPRTINNSGIMEGNGNGSIFFNTPIKTDSAKPLDSLIYSSVEYVDEHGNRVIEEIRNGKVFVNNVRVYTAPNPDTDDICIRNDQILCNGKPVYNLKTRTAISSTGKPTRSRSPTPKLTTTSSFSSRPRPSRSFSLPRSLSSNSRRPGHPTLSEYRDKLRSGEQRRSRSLRRGPSRDWL